jgi:hypothetical protein
MGQACNEDDLFSPGELATCAKLADRLLRYGKRQEAAYIIDTILCLARLEGRFSSPSLPPEPRRTPLKVITNDPHPQ